MITEELQKLYQSYTGVPAENITELPSSGSNRRYFRLTGIETLIGVYGASIDENEAFLYMAGHFRKCGLPVPEVRIASEDKTYYLQEDLGDTLLFHAIEKGRATSGFFRRRKRVASKDDPPASCYPVCRCRWFRIFPAAILNRSSINGLFSGI